MSKRGRDEEEGDSLKATPKKSVQKNPGYVKGSIVRIKLENILTYNAVEFQTGPFLNVVIGPNGTGKSTIVCAICLGLAGKTAWLGRASQPSEFIKYGHSKGKIELELYNPDGENHVIQREIFKDKSVWTVNGRKANVRSVELMVTNLNIQVGNLCQFLPQDRVAEFAKMSPQDLLENTEKAVSEDVKLYEYHNTLKDARKGSRQLEQNYENVTTRLAQEQQKNSRLEQDVKNFEERQRHLRKVSMLKMKRPWVEYEEKRRLFLEEKQQRDTAEEEMKRAQAKNLPLERKLEATRKKKDEYDAQMKQKSVAIKETASKVQANSQQLESMTDQLAEAQKDLEDKRQEEESRKREVGELNKQLQALVEELSSVSQRCDYQNETEKISQEIRKVNKEMNDVVRAGGNSRLQVDNLRSEIRVHQDELSIIQDISRRRLETLGQYHKHTYEAVMWLRENKHRFSKSIYEPMILCLNLRDSADAKFVETHISFNDLRAFVCEDPNDLEAFMSTMRDEKKLKVNVVKMPVDTVESFVPKKSIATYRKFGFERYLQDLFDCPDAVMRFLCKQYRVHMIPVGNNNVKNNIDRVINESPDLNTFYTPDTQYSIKRSRYGNREISARNTKLREAVFLAVSVDSQRQIELKDQIKNLQQQVQISEEEYNKMQSCSKELETKMNQLRRAKKELNEKKDQQKRLQCQIDSKKDSIDRAESEKMNLQVEEDKVRESSRKIALQKCQLLAKLCNNTKKCFELSQTKVRLSLQHSAAIHQHMLLEGELRDQRQSEQTLEAKVKNLREAVKQAKAVAKILLQKAKVATGTGPQEELSAEKKSAFEQCPSTLEEIDAQIHEQQARADCTFQVDERVVREFQHRKEEIDRLNAELERRGEERDLHQNKMEQTRENWIEPLKNLISQINGNFGDFFTRMKCTGEVDLDVPANSEDYEKYGVRIKVKFRDGEPLRELTASHQSGGERSVATVLYMMALQELATCPFKCVDEINQGMDPINERKVFELVVQTVCKKSTSQYFLLTPKLLPDLEYADNMTILCIHSGPNMMKHTEWNLQKFIRRREKLLA